VAAAVLVLALSKVGSESNSIEACQAVTAIASDERKMEYLKSWLAARLGNNDFAEVLQQRKYFERSEIKYWKYIDLDWKYLGFNKELVSVRFNSNDANSDEAAITSVGSMSISQNRILLIVRLDSSKDLGLRWPPEEMAKLTPVSTDVFVYCEN
jgi:hypothetical protein